MTTSDKRGEARKRILKGGRIVFNGRASTLSCTVRDISGTGARLRVAQGQALPSRFDLLIDTDGLEAPCRVAWRKGEDVGVLFEAPPTVCAPKRTQVIAAIGRAPTLRKPRP